MRTLYEQPLHYINSEKQTLSRFGGLLLLVGIVYPLKYRYKWGLWDEGLSKTLPMWEFGYARLLKHSVYVVISSAGPTGEWSPQSQNTLHNLKFKW